MWRALAESGASLLQLVELVHARTGTAHESRSLAVTYLQHAFVLEVEELHKLSSRVRFDEGGSNTREELEVWSVGRKTHVGL